MRQRVNEFKIKRFISCWKTVMPIVDFDTECWADPWVQGKTPLGKLLFIYLWTNTHRNISGMYIITKESMAFETNLTREQIDDCLKELDPKVKYDPEHSVCWVVKHTRRQFLRGEGVTERQKKGIQKHALKLRWHPFFKEFMNEYPEIFLEEEGNSLMGMDTHSKGIDTHSMGMDTLGGGGGGKGKGLGLNLDLDLEEKGGMGGKEVKRSTDLFEIFWQAYPKKKSRGQAEKAWLKIKPDEQLLEKILSTIEWAKTSVEWTKDGGQFIPYPATWLNAKGWEDEYNQTTPFMTAQPGIASFLKRRMKENGDDT
jgi:hypothetical protein